MDAGDFLASLLITRTMSLATRSIRLLTVRAALDNDCQRVSRQPLLRSTQNARVASTNLRHLVDTLAHSI